MIDINMNEVVEKPLLPAAQPFIFIFKKIEEAIAKEPNKHSGVREQYYKCECIPTDPQWSDRIVYQNWSAAMSALTSPDPVFSMVKFLKVIGYALPEDGRITPALLMPLKFVADVKYKEGDSRPNFARILRMAE